MLRIFDNIEASLLPALQDTLRVSERSKEKGGYLEPLPRSCHLVCQGEMVWDFSLG